MRKLLFFLCSALFCRSLYGQATITGPARFTGPVTIGVSGGGGAVVKTLGCNGAGNLGCTFTPTNAGDLLAVFVSGATGGTDQLVLTTDNLSDTWVNGQANSVCTNTSGNYCRVDYLANVSGSLNTITANCGACANQLTMGIVEMSGMRTTSPIVDVTVGAAGFGATTSWASNSGTTTHANNILLCFPVADGTSSLTWTGTGGWTSQIAEGNTTSNLTIGIISRIVSSATSYSCTATAASSNEGSMQWGAFEINP